MAVIDCGDGGTTTIDSGSCTVASNDDGSHTITCPGGDTVVVRDGEQLPRGTIAGEARRFGFPAEAGIEVTLVEKDLSVTTDADGRFSFDGVTPGLYRLRFSREGYAPLDVENVMVFGTAVDLGGVELKVARKIADGLVMPIPSPSGEHVAMLRGEFPSESGDLFLVDLETGAFTLLFEGVSEATFFDDRFLIARRYAGGDWEELLVHDMETDTSRSFDKVENMWWLDGGFILRQDGVHNHLVLATGALTELEGVDGVSEVTDRGHFAMFYDVDGAYMTYDVAAGSMGSAFDPWDWTWSYASGRVIGVMENDDPELPWALFHVDPTIGTPVELRELASLPAFRVWANEGTRFVFGTGTTATVFDTTDGTSHDVEIGNAHSVHLSPDGRWLVFTNDTGTHVQQVDGEALYSATQPYPSWVGGWMVTTSDDTFRVFDPAANEVVIERTTATWWWDFWRDGERAILSHTGDESFIIDLSTDAIFVPEEGDAEWYYVGAGQVAINAEETDMLSLFSLDDGTRRSVALAGWAEEISESGKTLLVSYNETELDDRIFAVSLDDLSVLPLDEKVLFFDVAGSVLWYMAGEFDPRLIPVAYDAVVNPFSDVSLYRAVLP